MIKNIIKILYVSHESGLNGAPKSLLELVTKIKEKGVYPIVVLPSRGKLKPELELRKIKTTVIKFDNCVCSRKYNVNEYLNYYIKNFSAVREIIKIINEENIDIVHSNSLAIDVGAIAAYIAKVPHVWHFREFLQEDFGLRFINPFIERWLIRKSVCRIAVSNSVKEDSEKKYRTKVLRIYNGIDKEIYYYPIQENKNLADKKRLIIAGSISEGKGQWDAIKALEILLKKGIDVNLVIAGDGLTSYVNSLKRYVQHKKLNQNIVFIPYTKNLQQLRQNCDIILVCSRMEAFGRVTAEAMMSGKIVVGSSTGGTQELIGRREDRGYLYTWGNSVELAEKIEYVIEHSDEVLKKVKRAQNYIFKLSDLDKYSDKLIEVYKKVYKGD